jgi:accessory secretory protein Asp2
LSRIQVIAYLDQDYSQTIDLPEGCEWTYEPTLEDLENFKEEYDVGLIGHGLTDLECALLSDRVRAHCLFFLSGISMTPAMNNLMKCRDGSFLDPDNLAGFLTRDLKDYFNKPYGQKVYLSSVEIAPSFQGRIHWEGMNFCQLEGDFGLNFQQLAYWRMIMPLEPDQPLEIWLEYSHSNEAEITLRAELFALNGEGSLLQQWIFSEEDLEKPCILESSDKGFLFFSLMARGKGQISVVSLHSRFSRHGKGLFLPGGKRFVTKKGEEFFHYFDPGDCKPPLAVYFSGYRMQEGFEGYYIMRRMHCPFLLISDPRLEGGAFYLGDREYEDGIRSVINHYLKLLGFGRSSLILSGMSMGTFGALYYGARLQPAYIILAKPLTSLGNIARAERLDRPGGFPTSLDVQWKQMRSLTNEASDQLNRKFWKRFSEANWSHTTFAIAYKIEDDYDRTAYRDILLHLKGNGTRVIGQGRHGRHNDNTGEMVSFFLRQYQNILRKAYGRQPDKEEKNGTG